MLINPGAIADGVLVNAVRAIAGMVSRPHPSRRTMTELDIAGWADTGALIKGELPGIRLELTGLTGDEATLLEARLRTDEVQAALQALCAARLTNATEARASQAREAVGLAITGRYAEWVSEYFDDKVCALVGHLEGTVGLAGLEQIRNEAYNSRILAVLDTIGDMLAALRHPGRGGSAEAEFLHRYAGQVRERHGKLQPPDFERRRRIPADKIYVDTVIRPYPEDVLRERPSRDMKVMDLAEQLDRTVLLGDPGGGKTTAANVLANHFASSPDRLIPFVVTLREYAATYPPERSIAEHIEHCLKTLYQCPAPEGLVERLLMTERAVVIFDGLDELLDTSLRRSVSMQIEHFCSTHPLTPVLVTSRLIGYGKAMLDVSQFACYRLDGFADGEVTEYAHKWFALQEGNSATEAEADAKAFIAESLHAQDVRSNPLLLSLMCILYQGAGTLPRDRPTIYAKCAELLLGRWDESRRIRHELRAGRHAEPAIQDLAWSLFTGDNPEATITERQLIEQTAVFLHERAFESEDEAWAAAEEFAKFLSGRMWVLSDVGTTADGEKLYAFTHRTFLEYFAAARLAAKSDTPEELAAFLVPRLLMGDGWRVAAELCLQIKSRASDRGADRFYAAALDRIGSAPKVPRVKVVEFLADCVTLVDPFPGTVRRLARVILDSDRVIFSDALHQLFLVHGQHKTVIADEMAKHIAERAESDDLAVRIPALLLAFGPDLLVAEPQSDPFRWSDWSREQTRIHAGQIALDSTMDYALRILAVRRDVLSPAYAIQMPGGLSVVLEELLLFATREGCGAVGRYLLSHPDLPWARVRNRWFPSPAELDQDLDEDTALGFAALACIRAESQYGRTRTLPFSATTPLPAQFKGLFQAWARGEVNFAEIVPG